eukprot:CAMPEP_0179069000 /NCGR_PEP_ID=MMETSP0796-20121207/30284_1 /TAXON_ID=73915 /ORGANISM="Pyrodinium bahamense, Strain pbaha01" /LENGTH=366 /DNA_ID=CAMNT_0020766057 /DNA_START=87 /DNA_END=1187 /DNA_ORIENTATION=+
MTPVPALDELRTCKDFEKAAHGCLSAMTWDYISGGEADTITANAVEFAALRIRPRVLVDVSSVDVSTSFLGAPRECPFYLSSVAKGGLVAGQEGEAAFVRAAARAGSAYIVPILTSLPYERIWAAAAPSQGLPFQFYLLGDESQSFELLRNALRLGTSAVVVTVDSNAPRAGAFRGNTGSLVGAFPSPSLTWAKLEEVRATVPSGVRMYLKGVQTGEDALQAAKLGLDGLIISNHGGRCCGDAWGSLSALRDVSEVLRAAGFLGRVELLLDSGVRSGRDAMKALCLGACGVGLGRPYYWASACHGEEGVVALLALLTAELQHAMAQAGASRLSELGPQLLCEAAPLPSPLTCHAGPAEALGARAKL